ncbi:site-specific DNA-methyltransferase [Thermoactinomyces daqus]|uniref:Methyltransferase n=1 Tax=Thermoactinomyces daqus TaxID=1329516 RepID=A0A7W1X8N3_9BACL|nr:site-specific DNA-methyltransferase [Thermoactinomyces daqus]MBA4542032.1 site-specific DNA-methyltransferase [Thermoactinomyces daqus]
MKRNEIYNGDVIETLRTFPEGIFNTCVTSPPYWGLRDYGVEGQIGLEKTPEEYVAKMVEVFREVRRVLRDDGTLWLNLGDSYAANRPNGAVPPTNTRNKTGHYGKTIVPDGLKPKDLVGIPWRVAFALQADGWWLRSDIIWAKPNAMPESVKDRPTKAHEYIFLLSKSPKYYYDADAIKEPLSAATVSDFKRRKNLNNKGTHGGVRADLARSRADYIPKDGKRNKRTVWSVNTRAFKGAHFAVFPPDLIEPCILAGSPEGGLVLDPFFGSGTTGLVARQNGRDFVGIELNPEYIEIARERLGLWINE